MLLSFSAWAKPPVKPSPVPATLPPILVEIEKIYSQAETLAADFKQEIEVVSMKQKKLSSGRILIKRPDKVRWETLKPQINLLVSDGKTYWFYTPPFDEGEKGQLMTRKASQIQSRLAQALLSGRFSVAHDMKIRAEGANRFVLTPKAGSAGTVLKAEIQINTEKKWIEKVILHNQGGNLSVISLSRIELGTLLRDELFFFVAPPGTDRIRD